MRLVATKARYKTSGLVMVKPVPAAERAISKHVPRSSNTSNPSSRWYEGLSFCYPNVDVMQGTRTEGHYSVAKI